MRNGEITLGWADGEYAFRLAWGQLIAVQEACDAGPAELLARFESGTWRIDDVRAVILHGLIGGGMAANQARQLVNTYVEQTPLQENLPVAQAALMAALYGAPPADGDEAELPPGKPEGA